LPCFVARELVEHFKDIAADNVAEFCLEMYRRMGLLEGICVARSSDPAFRLRTAPVKDYFVDVRHDGEIVRARRSGDKLLLHKGADCYIELPWQEPQPEQISPTRDTRLRWMQSVIRCTHYVAGAGEMQYLNQADAPEVNFVARDVIDESDRAYVGSNDDDCR
jgi:hypothetical protein